MTPARVVHLIATDFLGGPERQILGHMAALDRTAFEPVAASFCERGRPNEFLEAARERGYLCWELEARGKVDRTVLARLRKILSERDVAVLCVHGYKAHVLGRLATRGLGIPVLPFVRGFTAENWRVCAYEWLDRQLLRRSPMVVVVSQALKETIVRCGVRPTRVAVVHNAVDLDRMAPPSGGPTRAEIKASMGLSQHVRLAISVGRLSSEKGHRYLVAAAPRIVSEVPTAKLALVGDGAEAPGIRQQITDLGLNGCVVLAGFRRDVPALLRAADVFVLPSLSEGLPNAALEALAAGVPTVATAVGGTPEVVRHEQTGLLVPSQDPGALAEAVVRLLRDRELAGRLAREGRRLVEREFTFGRQARALEALYRTCVQMNPAGARRAFRLGAREACDEH